MRLKSWVKWMLLSMVVFDSVLVVLYLYMLRLIEIGRV